MGHAVHTSLFLSQQLWCTVQVFGLEQPPPPDAVLSVEPVQQGRELSERLNALIADLRKGRPVYPQCFVVRQGEFCFQESPRVTRLYWSLRCSCHVEMWSRLCIGGARDATCLMFSSIQVWKSSSLGFTVLAEGMFMDFYIQYTLLNIYRVY